MEKQKCILFGAGITARRLLPILEQSYQIAAVVDNDSAKVGMQLTPEVEPPLCPCGENITANASIRGGVNHFFAAPPIVSSRLTLSTM